MWTIYHALRVRRERPAAFSETGGYMPIDVRGEKARHAIAYLRGDEVVAIVPRLVLTRNGTWGDTSIDIPKGKWRDRLSGHVHQGGPLLLENALGSFPVALLVKE